MALWSRVHAHSACRRWSTRFKRRTAISGIEAPESTWLPIVSRDEQEGCYWQAGCRVGREAPVSGRCGIIYDITNEASKSGFGHPGCGGKEQDIASRDTRRHETARLSRAGVESASRVHAHLACSDHTAEANCGWPMRRPDWLSGQAK